MIYTSYFGNWRKFPENIRQVCISRMVPATFKGDACEALAPTWSLVNGLKSGEISKEKYTSVYKNMLEFFDAEQLAKDLESEGSDVVLLCFEKRGEFCHRHLVSEWLNKNNIKCEELL